MNRSRGAIGAGLVLVAAQALSACGGSAPSSAGPAVSATPPAAPATGSAPPAASGVPASEAPAAAPAGTAGQIADLRTKLASNPDDPTTLRDLGLALLQRVRETADPSLYAQAERALDDARRLAPQDPLVLVGVGGLQLGKHRFADALETAHAALALAPRLPAAKAVEVDALVELGRYDDATTAAAELVALRVDLTSLARISYLRELHGTIDGAVAAMRQAAGSPALAPENTAYVGTLLGNLLVYAGHPDEAAAAYDEALATVPDHAAAIAGLGRLAVGRGDLEEAIRRFGQASAILPLPEYVISLGEAQEANGDRVDAAKSYDLARAETQLFVAAGVDVDRELALFEADHGDAAKALELAQAAYRTRQTVRTADALAWAYHRSARPADAARLSAEALRLGSRDPLLLYHAGIIAGEAGDAADARADLTAALDLDPGFSATGAMAARQALADVAAAP
jgi:tetratricopeptide (TPR) repeat protein